MAEVRDECGIILAHSFDDVYTGLQHLQHRGKEAAGIAVMDDGRIDVIKWIGTVRSFGDHYLEKLLNIDALHNPMFMGHVRYSTSGDKKDVRNAHPRFTGGKVENRGSHLIARDVQSAVVHNGTLVGHPRLGTVESDTDLLLQLYEESGAEGVLRDVPAAYSAIFMHDGAAQVVRDRFGFRPLVLGEKKGRKVAASESRAIFSLGGVARDDMPPGSVATINGTGYRLDHLVDAPSRMCFFEANYLLHWKSSFAGRNVAEVRERLGRQLAREFRPEDVSMVTYVPTCPYPMAGGYAAEAGMPVTEIFYKMDQDRSFMGGQPREREASITRNLYVRDDVDLEGQVVLVVDDSIVRGNVSRLAVRLLKARGASKVYFASVTPPLGPIVDGIKRGCLYGVDMPPEPSPENEFIWRTAGQSVEGVRQSIGADLVYYLSHLGMFQAYGLPWDRFCSYCIGGPDPLHVPDWATHTRKA